MACCGVGDASGTWETGVGVGAGVIVVGALVHEAANNPAIKLKIKILRINALLMFIRLPSLYFNAGLKPRWLGIKLKKCYN